MDHALVLFQFVANFEMNADLAGPDFSEFQPEKLCVGNCGKRAPGARQLLWIQFLFVHPR